VGQDLSCIFVVVVVGLSLSDSLILSSKGAKRLASQWGNTVPATPNIFLYISKTPPCNPEESAVSSEQLNF
jgi:hypothetical protein